jgi:receptor protein-tyrosine kinase
MSGATTPPGPSAGGLPGKPPPPSHLAERAAERMAAASDLSLAMPNATRVIDAPTLAPPRPRPPADEQAAAEPQTRSTPPPGNAAGGSIVEMAMLSAAGLVVTGNIRTRISEEYRIAVSRILRASRTKRPGNAAGELLMVTSARPGEGKSFTAINLAGAIAHNVMRPTVLVDVDFKKRSVSHQLGLSDRMGLLDVASQNNLRIEDLIVPTAVEYLSVLPVGRDAMDLDGGEDMVSRRPVSQVIERLARRFPDHIFILDLPPCLSTSDPSTLAPVVSEIIMVVEAERTQRNEVEAALDLVKLCPKITLLLNKIRTTSSNTFGAYEYYGSYS